MSAPERQRWSCSQGAQGSRAPEDYTLSADELRWYDYPAGDLPGYLRLGEPDGRRRRVFGLDCEMVLTTSGPALARVALCELAADGDGGEVLRWPSGDDAPRPWRVQVLLDMFVKPPDPVVDYLTRISGVSANDLEGVTRTAEEARAAISALVQQDDILCGHGLAGDLHALRVIHERVIDTLVLYPHHDGPPYKRSLEDLCLEHLQRRIQVYTHSPVEDAHAALALVRLRVESGQGRLLWAPIPEGEESVFSAPTLALLCEKMRLAPQEVRCIFLRGSRAVGYAGMRGDGSPSDWDFVIVTAYRGTPQEDVHLSYGNLEAVLYDEQTFSRLIRDCCIWALECIYAPRSCILKEEIDFRAVFAQYRALLPREVFLAKLRRSVSFESGRQWSKAKRYLEQKGDQYACRKRMFIALRFLIYGLEVARTGEIADLRCANHLWDERLKDEQRATWPALRLAYEPLYKELKEAFHRAAPKLPRYGGPRLRFQAARGAEKGERGGEERAGAPAAGVRSTLSPALLVSPAQSAHPSASADPASALATVRRLRAIAPGDPEAALAALKEAFRLNVRQHARFPNVVQLRYTPQSSPEDHPIVRECRGLILDAARGWEVLAFPFERFFNLDERAAYEAIDWSTARLYEKLDGSLAILYWYEGAWRVASSRRPDASGLLGLRSREGAIPFETLFWEIWGKLGYRLPPPPSHGERLCYLFELTSRRHPIIVRYPDDRLTLIGARDLTDHRELDPAPIAALHGWECVRSYPLPGPAPSQEGGLHAAMRRSLKEAARALDPSLQEGFVVCDAQFRRVKVKSPDYVRMTWMFPLCATRRGISRRHMLQVVLSGETQEFLAYCPEHRAELEEVQEGYNAFCATVEAAYEGIRDTMEPKEFALLAKRYPFADVLFAMRRQGVSVQEALGALPIKRVERWLFSGEG